MNKKALVFSLLLPLSLVFSGCSSTLSNKQLEFGIQAAQKDLWDEAIFRWQKVVKLHPKSAAAHNNLAVAYEKKGQWEDAEKAYKSALELSPDNKYIQANYKSFTRRFESDEEEKSDKAKNEKK